ncbi:recQ-mediated genome instability protein 2 [Morus notabilis]|uniref:recQ-mediated genome instability protein 2 n=1 Tax=Morus notabilis TaxID=981085 RepID=UPI000CED77EB|nr:recQ-mediated genome instability protein 2 [Morus notabilis]
MDYNLAAVKVVCSQLKEARQTASPKRMTLGGILFQRVWLQGVLVWASADSQKFILDDGTGLLHLHLSPSPDFLLRPWKIGMYVMVVGGYVIRTDEPPVIKVHKIVDLSEFPDREAMWYLEVMEAYKLFYESLIEEFI